LSSEAVSFTLQLTVDQAVTELRRVQTFAYQTLSLMRKLGLPEDMEEAAVRVQRLIFVMNQARLAAIALHAASGPIGWALAGIGIAATAVTTIEMMEVRSR